MSDPSTKAPSVVLHPDGAPPTTPEDAIEWLRERGAHPWLLRHHQLVVETACELVGAISGAFPASFDAQHVLLAASLHDAGKIKHPREMSQPGKAHEPTGESMLRSAGFPEHIARIGVTHSEWTAPRATFEDRLVALADKLWKGKRDDRLERALVAELAQALTREAWEVFDPFDAICERIASAGPSRLRRAQELGAASSID